jgi:hypothetical protein
MRAYSGSGGAAPLVFIRGCRWRWLVSSVFWTLYARERTAARLKRRLSESQCASGRSLGTEKFVASIGFRTRTVRAAACSLSQLLYVDRELFLCHLLVPLREHCVSHINIFSYLSENTVYPTYTSSRTSQRTRCIPHIHLLVPLREHYVSHIHSFSYLSENTVYPTYTSSRTSQRTLCIPHTHLLVPLREHCVSHIYSFNFSLGLSLRVTENATCLHYTGWCRADGHNSEFPPVRLVRVSVCSITASKTGLGLVTTGRWRVPFTYTSVGLKWSFFCKVLTRVCLCRQL